MLDQGLVKSSSFQISSFYSSAQATKKLTASDLAVTSDSFLSGSIAVPFASGFASWFRFVFTTIQIVAEPGHLDPY